MDQRASQPILAVDLLRFVCAVLVLAFHLTTVFPLTPQAAVRLFDANAVLPGGVAGATWFGWIGVELFFVISGYVIALSGAHIARGAFVRRRALRLVPAAWIGASVAALLLLLGTALPPANVVARWICAMLFVPVPNPIDASYWTLSVELIFYALVAAALRDGDNRVRLERAGIALGIMSATFWGAVAVGAIQSETVFGAFALTLTLLPHGIFFALGILLSAIRSTGATRRRIALAAGFTAVAAAEVVLHAQTMRGISGLDTDPVYPVAVFLTGVAMLAFADRLQHTLARSIGAARLKMLGRMTYPLYLLHQTIAAAAVAALIGIGVSGGLALAVAAAIVLATAWLVSERVEPHVRIWLARRIDARFSRDRDLAPDSLRSAFPPTG